MSPQGWIKVPKDIDSAMEVLLEWESATAVFESKYGEPLTNREKMTATMFEKFNAVLRSFTKVPSLESRSQKLCQGNLYTTTLHCINSSVVKLGKLTVARPVYRGECPPT